MDGDVIEKKTKQPFSPVAFKSKGRKERDDNKEEKREMHMKRKEAFFTPHATRHMPPVCERQLGVGVMVVFLFVMKKKKGKKKLAIHTGDAAAMTGVDLVTAEAAKLKPAEQEIERHRLVMCCV